MWYPARQLVKARFSVANLNAQLATLNSGYGLSAPQAAPTILQVYDFYSKMPRELEVPAVTFKVALVEPQPAELIAAGKRDALISLVLEAISQRVDADLAWDHVAITMEAFVLLLEQLEGTTFQSRYGCTWVGDLLAQQLPVDLAEAPAQVAARLRTHMIVRRMD